MEQAVSVEASSGGLSASSLKYIAAFAMLLDHFAAVFVSETSFLWFLMRGIGRLSFPIFAYFVAEGCARTHDLPGYAKRLFLFALAAQLPYMFAFQTGGASVILTFFLAVSAISFYESARDSIGPVLAVLPALLPALYAELAVADYGMFGVLLVLALYLSRNNRTAQFFLLLFFLVVFYQNIYAVFACCALLPLKFYRGSRGRGGKWFFYWFYPAHLLLFGLINLFF